MNRTAAESLLRILLGDTGKSIWSDTDLRAILDRSNNRMYRKVVLAHPSVAVDRVGYTYGADEDEIDLSTDISGSSVNQWISIEKVFWKPANTTMYQELPVVQLDELEELDAGTNTTYDLAAIIHNLHPEQYYCVFRAGNDKLMVRPIPNKSITVRIYGTQYLGETTMSGGDVDLMGGHFTHLHEAVVHDAGYLATFKDQTLRDEFKQQREDILALVAERSLVERRSN